MIRMAWRRWTLAAGVALIGVLLACLTVFGQQRTGGNRVPGILKIEPISAQVGATTVMRVSGKNLNNLERVLIDGEGVSVENVASQSNELAEVVVRVDAGAEPGFRLLRVLGPDGLSHVTRVRIDTIPTRLIEEPEGGDAFDRPVPVRRGESIQSTVMPQDLDFYAVDLKQGEQLVAEIESRRLGYSLAPVLSILDANGLSLAEAAETRGLWRDARVRFRAPRDGLYVVRVRDKLYKGGEQCQYLLRLSDEPFAEALFPLGGAAGAEIELEASGGSLAEPRRKRLPLTGTPGSLIDAGASPGAGGSVRVPMSVELGQAGSECGETEESASSAGQPIAMDRTINGRIGRAGEVDRYRLAVKRRQAVLVRLRAASLGSWLDSVVRVLDEDGNVLAENDDEGVESDVENVNPFASSPASSSDSRVQLEAAEDGVLLIEVFDRFGAGGPQYGYRLAVGQARPDFRVGLLFGDPNLNQPSVFFQNRQAPRAPGANGSLNLRPGSSLLLNLLVTAEGGIEKVELTAEGLPPGVTANPVTIALPAGSRRRALRPVVSGGAVRLEVAPDAEPALGSLRIVGRAKANPEGPELKRVAVAEIPIDAVRPGGSIQPLPSVLSIEEIPVWVLRRPGMPAARSGTASGTGQLATIDHVVVPGVLLQGGKLDMALEFVPPLPVQAGVEVRGETTYPGLGIETLVTETRGPRAQTTVVVRLIADPSIAPGLAHVNIRLTHAEGRVDERVVPVLVRSPARLSVSPLRLGSEAGAEGSLTIVVERAPGFHGAIDLAASLPRGVHLTGPEDFTIPAERSALTLTLVRDLPADQERMEEWAILGKIAMPRGMVEVQSPIRPMFSPVQGR